MAGSPKKRARRLAAEQAAKQQPRRKIQPRLVITAQNEEKIEDGQPVQYIRDQFVPTAKQQEFFDACRTDGVDEILFGGSIRGGKTQACCKQIVAWAWERGGRYVIARKTYRELEDSTKAILLRGEGGLPPALPPQLYDPAAYRAGDNMVTLKNGAEILFRSLESTEESKVKLRNLSLNAAFIDQVEELTDERDAELYQEISGRLSDPRGPGKIVLAANPGPTDHWVYKRFIDLEHKLPWCRYVHVQLTDNQDHLPHAFIERAMRTEKSNPDYYKRFILGEWGAFGGKRFRAWSEDLHVVEPLPSIPKHWEIMESIDYGYAHPFVCLWIAIDENERWWVIGEHSKKEWYLSQHARAIKQMREELNVAPSVTWCDPSVFNRQGEHESVALEMYDLGLYPAKAQNERLGGWARLDEFLTENLFDGRPRLQVFNTCRNLIKEIPNARIKEGYDDIEKVNDHALDALRYAVMSRPVTPEEPHEDDPDYDRREAYARELIESAYRRETTDLYVGE